MNCKGWLRTARNTVYFLGALLVAAVVAELVPALQELEAWMEERETLLVTVTGTLAGIGVLMLVGSMLAHMIRSPGAPSLEFRIGDLKRSAAERRRFPWTAAVGGAGIFFGVFGTLISVAPMALKLVLAAIALYAIVNIVLAVIRA